MAPVETIPASTASRLARFIADERGATAVEYALIASGLAVAIAGTVWSLGTTIKTGLYDKVSAGFK